MSDKAKRYDEIERGDTIPPLLCKEHGSPLAFAGVGFEGGTVQLVCLVGQEVYEARSLIEEDR